MQASVKNWKKPTPRKIKMIGDTCVYTLPMWQGLITTSPFSDTWKICVQDHHGAIRYHIANDLCKTSQDSAVLDCRAIRLPQPCRMQGAFASLLRGHDSTEPVSVDDTHEGLCTVRRVRAALSRTVRGRKPADTPPRRYNAGANTKRKQ